MMIEHYQFTLALFTLLAPAGALAFVVMAVPIMGAWGGSGAVDGCKDASTSELAYHRISRYLIVPLAVAMVGLVVSATHLGTPSNALYVLMGWGRSPLSNEVVAAIAFLGLSGLYWLSAFRTRLPLAYVRVMLGLICVASLFLVWKISIVYAIRTIITWNTDSAIVGLWCTALCSGFALGIVGLAASRTPLPQRYLRVLCLAGIVALVGAAVTFAYQCMQLPGIENWTTTAAQLVPRYGFAIALFVLCAATGWGLIARPVIRGSEGVAPLRSSVAGAALVCAGVYLMRVAFYGMHMTGGF